MKSRNTNPVKSETIKRPAYITSGLTWIVACLEQVNVCFLKEAKGDPVDETSWIVNQHPVPWIFHAGGTVEAPTLWTGNWQRTEEGYRVTMRYLGTIDSFLVKFSSDWSSFTVHKNGKLFRSGVRKR
ncbi:MAG: hypothetical protein RDV48_25695 [Candidatus Eremiobacteraeota bacterium]|nr:hypothetical protein [Candidatus Eremiobacteraeota bacterium]